LQERSVLSDHRVKEKQKEEGRSLMGRKLVYDVISGETALWALERGVGSLEFLIGGEE